MTEIAAALIAIFGVFVGAFLNNRFESGKAAARERTEKRDLASLARSDLINISRHSGRAAGVAKALMSHVSSVRSVDIQKFRLPEQSLIAMNFDESYVLPDKLRTMIFRLTLFLRNNDLEIVHVAERLNSPNDPRAGDLKSALSVLAERFALTEEITRTVGNQLEEFRNDPDSYKEPSDDWWNSLFKSSKVKALARLAEIETPESPAIYPTEGGPNISTEDVGSSVIE